jgi:hypothetical protein
VRGISQQKPLVVHTPLGSEAVTMQTLVAAPQAVPAPQLPQDAMVRDAWQLSVAVSAPHVLPNRAHSAALVSATQLHWFDGEQVLGLVQLPQLATVRLLPQLSAAVTAPH